MNQPPQFTSGVSVDVEGDRKTGAGEKLSDLVKPPCLGCGKVIRRDFHGYCMDCADESGISDAFPREVQRRNLATVEQRPMTAEEKEENLAWVEECMARKMRQGE